MEPSGQRDLRLALAGLQAGCLGSLLMIGWWLLGEVLQRRSPWTVPNLLATTFYGERAYRAGFIVPTWSGLALALAIYCAAGVAFALAGRERKSGWGLLLVGAAAGLALNWLLFGIALKRLNPLVGLYSPDRLITWSHLLYGIALASYPGYARDLSGPVEVAGSGAVAAEGVGMDVAGVRAAGSDAAGSDATVPPTPVPDETGSGAEGSTQCSTQEVGGSIPQSSNDAASRSIVPEETGPISTPAADENARH